MGFGMDQRQLFAVFQSPFYQLDVFFAIIVFFLCSFIYCICGYTGPKVAGQRGVTSQFDQDPKTLNLEQFLGESLCELSLGKRECSFHGI
jgi:hypothetical protein